MRKTKLCAASKLLSSILLLTLVLTPLIAQTSAQSTPLEQEKAISFLKDVIQLDLNHYDLTLTTDNLNIDTLYLAYKLESKAFLSLEKSQTISFQFYNGSLTSFGVQPGSDLVFTQSRPDRFNETLAILERYQAWLNDPQVGEMVALMQQVGSERNVFEVSGNLSLRILGYSNTAEYHFSNYINRAEYSGIVITQTSTGAIFFTDTRASQPIGDTTIGISEDQAITIAQNYVAAHPFRVNTGDSKEITNLKITGVKAVVLKSSMRVNHTLFPYYEVQFNVENLRSSVIDGCGVNIGAKDGDVWSSYSSSASTNTLPMPIFSILVTALATFLIVAAVIAGVYLSRLRFKTTPPVAE